MTPVLVPPSVTTLEPWVAAGVLGPAEVHAAAIVAEAIAADEGEDDGDLDRRDDVVLAFALALWAPQHGHACIDLAAAASLVDVEVARAAALDGSTSGPAPEPVVLPWPDAEAWIAALRASRVVRVVETVDAVDAVDRAPVLDDRPAVLHGTRLYTQRQWVDECTVATDVRSRASRGRVAAPPELLDRLLPPAGDGTPNAQRQAAIAAATAPFTVVAGGPGTGKTHTVACLLAAELAGDPSMRIAVAAPTGKAASRIGESIAAVAALAEAEGELPPDVAERLRAVPALTVHRLLGPRPDHRTRFRHDVRNPVPYDLVVVDEASMLSLPLTARLLEAVPDDCRLVLVGDPGQLASVETGNVLADVVAAGETTGSPSGIGSIVVQLTRQHRTGPGSPIGPLAAAIREGDADAVVDALRGDTDDVRFVELVDAADPASAGDAVLAAVMSTVGPPFAAARDAAEAGDAGAAFSAVGGSRILCAHRRGPFGVDRWNAKVEAWLGVLTPGAREYAGRALLATRNDPRTGIANGDTGVLVRRDSLLRAVFRRAGSLADFALAELDDVETAFATTVHKSQGSEYPAVALIHPPADSPLTTRELLYTAVTRTSGRLLVVGSAESIRRAVETPTRRVTGLRDALG